VEIYIIVFYGDFCEWYKNQGRFEMDCDRFSLNVGINGITFLRTVFDNSDNIKLVKSYVYNDAIGMSEGGTEDYSYETNSGERLYLGVDADTALGEYSWNFLVSELSENVVSEIGTAFGEYFGKKFEFNKTKLLMENCSILCFYENKEFRDKYIDDEKFF